MNTDQLNQHEALLVKNGLKKTGARLRVLDILSGSEAAASQPDIEHVVGKDIDRVTLYRILKTFEEKGIIHRIIDNQGTANYAFCHNNCSEHAHHDEHLHFNCVNCQKVYCIDNAHLPHFKLNLPPGFSLQQLSFVATGRCENCSKLTEQK
ncbi:Fur family transcriptional regulator [Pedobacter yulinensis]|uniref:Fur family transcriptional regulator n=1 Tax=Pedobacter yulinensis TaxID=2126353 RepID=A0A2T3HLN2_9SPHI|nr:transcriptional repressor [Pedobacter yulinensis]PST83352.1 Fur family transcriptional regulator [Pedobacter yulinensis]